VNQNYANILLMLLRLRQACDHPLLVKGFNSESVEKDSAEMANQLPREMVVDLLNRVTSALCRVCNVSHLKNPDCFPKYSMPLVRSCWAFSLLLP
jgi:SNF2 family DNA or RNA helicase